MATEFPDLLYGTMETLETQVAIQDIAELCLRAEAGKGAEAAVEFLGSVERKVAESVAKYADLSEEDIVSFYRLKKAFEIAGPWGVFWLATDHAKEGSGVTVITPIGLYALATEVKALLKDHSDEGY